MSYAHADEDLDNCRDECADLRAKLEIARAALEAFAETTADMCENIPFVAREALEKIDKR